MKRAIGLILLLLGGAVITPVQGAGLIIVHDSDLSIVHSHPHHHPHPPPRPHPPIVRPRPPHRPPVHHHWAPLEVAFVKAEVKVKDQVARTHIVEEFYNPNSRRLEGTFLFPVPKGAALEKFTMDINGKQVEAELLKADKARSIYENIVRSMKDPALLEYAGQDLFKVRIFPIEPRSKKRITLDYSQLLKSDNGLVEYTFPLNTKKYSAKPLKSVSVKVKLESSRPLKSIYSPSHPVEIKRDGEYKATAGFEANNIKPDTDVKLLFAQEEGAFGLNLLTHKTGDGRGYFALLASPGAESTETRIIPKDVVFVLDTSGSMAGPKLKQAKKAINFCVENLNDEDRFEVLRFSTEPEPLFESLQKVNAETRDKATQFIGKLKPIGGTAIHDALSQALAMKPEDSKRPFVVIFLTDGRPTVGTTDENLIVKEVAHNRDRQSLTRVFCFGIGTDVNTHLLDRITEKTKSYSQYVLPEEDIEVKVSSFFTKIKEPVLANPSLKFPEGVRVTKMYPAPLPDLFKGEQLVVVGRYQVTDEEEDKIKGRVTIKGSVAGETKSFSYTTTFARRHDAHDFIPRLWATRRVGYLLDEIRLRGENKELREEVISLARNYGIVTPYTTYLIVEDEKQLGIAANRQIFRPELYSESVTRDLSSTYSNFSRRRSGNEAVGGARSLNRLKQAEAASESLDKANADAFRGGALAGTRSSLEQRARLAVPAADAAVTATSPAPPQRTGKGAKQQLGDIQLGQEWSKQGRYVAGRTFYKKDKLWIDGSVRGKETAKPIRIQFDSKEYYELIGKHPEALGWLSLGRNLQVVLDDQVYEIHE